MTGKKIKLAILFGGKSAEHEVSLFSAKNIYNAINKDKFDCTLIGIEKNGIWKKATSAGLIAGEAPKIESEFQNRELSIPLGQEGIGNEVTDFSGYDVVFPVLHGQYGEDGSIQGLLKVADLPFVGPSVLGSAVGMDKDVMKRLLRDSGIPIGKFLSFTKFEKENISFEKVSSELGLPVFIKPANQGSSIGISKAENEMEFIDAINLAFIYDRKIIIEENIIGREIECAVLGNEVPIASRIGEVISNKNRHSFYSYEAKYFDEKGAAIEIPASIDNSVSDKAKDIAIATYKCLCCEGMARVDFFLKEDGNLIVNEINTIPGFTKSSMYPKLWEASGIQYGELIEKLIDLAIQRHSAESEIRTSV